MEYKEIEKKFKELEQQLNDLEVLKNPQKLKDVSKEYADTKLLLNKIDKLEKIKKAIKEAQKTIEEETDEELINFAQEELPKLQNKKERLETEIKLALKPQNPLDKKDAIMEIRAGTGGDEAALFAADLFRMYSKFAEKRKWTVNLLSSNRTGIGGFKEVIFKISGNNVYGELKFESGVHRVQRVPETEKSGRIHTSAATVAVLPEAEEIDLKIDPKDLKIEAFCSSGHGGQSVNTTYSAIRITHIPTDLTVSCQDERSQTQNKEKAMAILRSKLFVLLEEKKQKEIAAQRKMMVKTGDRSDKIRTYNWPQDRVTDHRVKTNWYGITNIMAGEIDELITKLKETQG